ncbi:hypothetical protein D3C75_756260 [compost metagenome]
MLAQHVISGGFIQISLKGAVAVMGIAGDSPLGPTAGINIALAAGELAACADDGCRFAGIVKIIRIQHAVRRILHRAGGIRIQHCPFAFNRQRLAVGFLSVIVQGGYRHNGIRLHLHRIDACPIGSRLSQVLHISAVEGFPGLCRPGFPYLQ